MRIADEACCPACGHDTFRVGLIGRGAVIAESVTEDGIIIYDILDQDIDVDDDAQAECEGCGETYWIL